MKPLKIVIVGGVAAGASAAAKARRCDENAEIILFEKGPDISYATCGLPYYLSGVIQKRKNLVITSAAFFQKRFKIDVRTHHEVVRIDRLAKKVICLKHDTGKEIEETYDKLILTPGSTSLVPPVPGIDLPFVYSLKSLEDTDKIFAQIQKRKPENVVIIGGGLIGIESAENFIHIGSQVSLVEFMPQVLSFMDHEMAEIVKRHVNARNVQTYLGEKLVAIQDIAGNGFVKTDTGRSIPADLVILAIGIRPDTKLADAAGLKIGTTGAILVDKYMQTSDPHILAAGDCVESIHLVTGKPAIFPMGAAANKQGRAAGANATGRQFEVKGFTGTVIVKVFNLAVAKTGLNEKEALLAGYTPFVSYVLANDHAGYYPGAKDIRIKTISERENGRILGAQIIGEKGVDKRIDVMATAIYNRMTVEDLMHLDLAYAPPYSSARDPIFVSGAIGQNFYNGDYSPITPAVLHDKIKSGDKLTIVDVRTRNELLKTGIIPGAVHLPIDELRNRLGELDNRNETVLYCAVGLRSYLGFRILKMKGFELVSSLTGGIGCWTYSLTSYTESTISGL